MTLSPFVAVYKSDWSGHVYPDYIILKTQPQVFERYLPGIYEIIVGQWSVKNDTLFLFPKYDSFIRNSELNSELEFSVITPKDSTLLTIPQQYLIKNDCLIDITDYSIILPELLDIQNCKTVYKRVTKK